MSPGRAAGSQPLPSILFTSHITNSLIQPSPKDTTSTLEELLEPRMLLSSGKGLVSTHSRETSDTQETDLSSPSNWFVTPQIISCHQFTHPFA